VQAAYSLETEYIYFSLLPSFSIIQNFVFNLNMVKTVD
jgi:hypothetical protein